MATGNLVGYRVEVRAGRTSKPQYLTGDLKTTDAIGYVWKKETSAKNAMKSYRAYIANKKIPCAAMKVVELIDDTQASVINMNDKTDSPSDNKKSAEDTASAQSEEITAKMNDEAKPAAAENMGMVESADPANAAQSSDIFQEILSASQAWADVMAHLDSYQCLFSAQLSEEDNRTQDILHYVELNDLPDDQAAAVMRMLAASRHRRREAKDALSVLEALAPAKFAAQQTSQILKRMDKRHYHPRIDENLAEKIASETSSAATNVPCDVSADAEPAPQTTSADDALIPQPAPKSMAEIVAERRAESTESARADMKRADQRAINVYMDHESGVSGVELAKRYGVSQSTISRDIVRGRDLVDAQTANDGLMSAFDTPAQANSVSQAVDSASKKLLGRWLQEHEK